MSHHRYTQTAKYLGAIVLLPSIPLTYWTYWSRDERDRHLVVVKEKHANKVPNVQTIDDVLMEHVLPGDVLLFDRRCQFCQSPLAALACLLGRKFVSNSNSDGDGVGNFDHVGIVVPNPEEAEHGAPYLLEYTPQQGVVARPLLERVEYSRSRSVLLLPLSLPGERRDPSNEDDHHAVTEQSTIIRDKMNQRLYQFHDGSIRNSQTNGFANMHSTLSIFGALAYAIGIHEKFNFLPVNPSAFFAASALQEAGVALNVEQRSALNAKSEDFLRDHRFQEEDCIRLRPGFKFMRPLAIRENN